MTSHDEILPTYLWLFGITILCGCEIFNADRERRRWVKMKWNVCQCLVCVFVHCANILPFFGFLAVWWEKCVELRWNYDNLFPKQNKPKYKAWTNDYIVGACIYVCLEFWINVIIMVDISTLKTLIVAFWIYSDSWKVFIHF